MAWIIGVVVGCARLYPAPSVATLPSRILPPPVVFERVESEDGPDAESTPSQSVDVRQPADATGWEQTWTLAQAVEFAERNNPRLRSANESVAMAQGGRQTAFAPFLPSVVSSVKYVASASEVPGFSGTYVPFVIGLGPGVQQFDLAEMQVQWTVWDFGRSWGRYQQASDRVEVARLLVERARQTVAFDVASAYLRLLYTQAMQAVERQAVVQAEAMLKDARDDFEGGVVDRDAVLRAEVQLADSRQKLVSFDSAEQVAASALNLAMGRNVSAPARVAAIDWEPPMDLTLPESLQLAVDNRREFEAARQSIAIAQYGSQAAQAEFLPRIFVRGVLAHVDGQGIDVGNVQIGAIHVEQGIYEGGRRAGEAKTAKAAVRAAEAQAQVVCDNIAFEVNQAYRAVADARQRIALAKAAVALAQENLRIVVDKYKTGDRKPTDVVEAQTSMVRAGQSRWTALFDYQASLVRLEYATGAPLGSVSGLIDPIECTHPIVEEQSLDVPPADPSLDERAIKPIFQEEPKP